MILHDMYLDCDYNLKTIKSDYEEFRKIEPWNHADTFRTELLEIIMATINGRNDLDLVGPTPAEVCRIIDKLRKEV